MLRFLHTCSTKLSSFCRNVRPEAVCHVAASTQTHWMNLTSLHPFHGPWKASQHMHSLSWGMLEFSYLKRLEHPAPGSFTKSECFLAKLKASSQGHQIGCSWSWLVDSLTIHKNEACELWSNISKYQSFSVPVFFVGIHTSHVNTCAYSQQLFVSCAAEIRKFLKIVSMFWHFNVHTSVLV